MELTIIAVVAGLACAGAEKLAQRTRSGRNARKGDRS